MVGTGKTYTIKYFAENAFNVLGLDFQKYIKINKKFFRPAEVDLLVADSSKIKSAIGWKAKTNLKEAILKSYNSFLKEMKK